MRTINRSILFLCVIAACGVSASSSSEPNNFCQGCRSIVSFMGKLNKTESREAVAETLNDYCQTLYPASSDHQHPCNWFVNGVFFVMDRTDPVYHCDQIGACGKSDLSTLNRAIEGPSPNSDDSFCSACEELVNEAKEVLESPVAIDMASKQLDVICDYFAIVGLSGDCKQMVNKYIDQVVEFVHHVDPLSYCQSIRLCDSKRQQIQTADQLIVSAPIEIEPVEPGTSVGTVEPIGNLRGPYCSLCKTVVKELFHFLRENKTEENIRDGLEKICKLIYSDKGKISECDNMVDTYTRELIEILAAESDPNLVCILIEQCTYQKLPNRAPQIAQSEPTILEETETAASPIVAQSRMAPVKKMNYSEFLQALEPSLTSFETCLQCKMFIRFLRARLGDQKTEDEVKEFVLTRLCAYLEDEELKNSCTHLVNDYANVFFKAVLSELNPQSACIALAACKNMTLPAIESVLTEGLRREQQTKEVNRLIEIVNYSVVTNSLQCDYCEELVNNIDEFVATKPQPLDEGTLAAELCPRHAYPKVCQKMIAESEELFLTYVQKMEKASRICEIAGYCPAD